MFRRHEPIKPCACGKSRWETSCTEIGLSNHRSFPPFRHLPDENEIDLDYYTEAGSSFHFKPSRHWALIGEIVQDCTDWVRPRAMLRTKYGENVLVNFHLEDRSCPFFFSWDDLVVGSTMCILYPHRRTFLDLNEGIRQEHSKTVMVFPATLDKLNRDCNTLCRAADTPYICFCCGSHRENMKKCSRCLIATYCDRNCQIAHWKASHKKLCKHMGMLQNLVVDLQFNRVEGFVDWSFVPEDF